MKSINIKLLLIFIVTSYIVSSNFITSKISNANSYSYSITSSKKNEKNMIEDAFSKLFYTPRIIDFTCGVLSSYFPAYIKIFKRTDIFLKISNCFEKDKFKELYEGSENKNVNIDKKWTSLKSFEQRKEFCINAKKEIETKFKSRSWGNYLKNSITNPDYCQESKEMGISYVAECYFFKDLNCSKLNDVLFDYIEEFLNKSLKFIEAVSSSKLCMNELAYMSKEFKKETEDSFKYKLSNGLNKGDKNVSGDTWGGIKGSYYLTQLGLNLVQLNNELSNSKNTYHYFSLGELVGKAMRTAKRLNLNTDK